MIGYRLAEESDVPVMEKLIARSVFALQAAFYTASQMKATAGTLFSVDSQLIRDRTYFVAMDGKKIVGCGGWSKRKSFPGGDKMKASGAEPLLDPETDPARLRAFFIDPDYARRGIGSEIVRLSEAAIIAAGFFKVDIVATLPGEQLYARFDYAVVKRGELELSSGEMLPVVEMEKEFQA